jgi:hypothetical protein
MIFLHPAFQPLRRGLGTHTKLHLNFGYLSSIFNDLGEINFAPCSRSRQLLQSFPGFNRVPLPTESSTPELNQLSVGLRYPVIPRSRLGIIPGTLGYGVLITELEICPDISTLSENSNNSQENSNQVNSIYFSIEINLFSNYSKFQSNDGRLITLDHSSYYRHLFSHPSNRGDVGSVKMLNGNSCPDCFFSGVPLNA